MRSEWRQAAIDGDVEQIERLIGDGLAVDTLDRYGQTALMLAAVHGRDDVATALIANGAALDVTAKFGLSALMLAIVNHRIEIALALIDAGADTDLCSTGAPGFFEKTACDLAQERGLKAIVAAIASRR